MKKYTASTKYIIKLTACLMLAVTVLSFAVCPVSADERADLFSARYDEPVILPYKDELTFSHDKGTGVLSSRTLSFHSPTMSIVTICYTNGMAEGGNTSHVTVSVYSDTAELICKKNAEDGVTLLQFIPVYTGTYHVVIESRSADSGEYKASVEISASTGYSQNKIDSYPHSKSYTQKNHKTNKVRELYPKTMYPNTNYMLSVFELKNTPSSVVSYKLSTPDSSEIRAVLYTDEGERYLPHQSRAGEGYAAGDAQELYYEKSAYLFVYSKGEFSLELDLLTSGEPTVSEIPASFKGTLDVSDAALLYDEQRLNEIITEFPFSEIKNRNVKFFRLNVNAPCVVSFLCDRKEHAYFSLVSDVYGLSYGSLYPLRSYNEYCSEVEPTTLCYGSVISDGAAVYLAYTGTAERVYAELYSSATHTTLTEFDGKYSQDTPLPQIAIRNIYDDKEIFKILGVEQNAPDISKVNGYMLESESMYRHYYEGTDIITPPAQKGKYKLYVIINSSIMSENGSVEEKYYSYFVSEISIDGKFSLPTVDDIISAVENNDPTAVMLVIILGVILLGGIAAALVTLIKRRVQKRREDISAPTVTDHAILPDNTEENAKEDVKEKE